MRNETFNKIGKIVAVSIGIILMGAIFSGCGGASGISVAESCNGSGIITQQSRVKIEGDYKDKWAYKEVGECKNGLKEGIWKAYDSNNKIVQETNYTGGILNGATKIINNRGRGDKQIFYENGKIVGELYNGYVEDKIAGRISGGDFYQFYQYEENSRYIKRYREYAIRELLRQDKEKYDKKVRDIKDKNAQIEQENRQMQWEAEQKVAEAKQKAVEIAKQRAQSKVKKPTMQEVAKSKSIMDSYREKLKAQEEKELQIELAKIQIPQITTKQSLSIPSSYQKPKLETYEEILTYIKDKKYAFVEYLADTAVKIESSQDSDGKNFKSVFWKKNRGVVCEIKNDTFSGSDCWKVKNDYLFEDLISRKSIFKDKINAILPNK